LDLSLKSTKDQLGAQGSFNTKNYAKSWDEKIKKTRNANSHGKKSGGKI